MKKITITPNITIQEAMKKMSDSGEKCLIIVNENNLVLGTLSDGDLRKAILNGLGSGDMIENIYQTKEVVINIVNQSIVEKAVISSGDYAPNEDEFLKAGLTPIKSKIIKPYRVKESPVQMECKVNNIHKLGERITVVTSGY